MTALLYTENIQVRWGDIDALRHINNSNYFTYFEQARAAWMRQHEIFYMPGGEMPVLAAVSAAFRRPIHFPATVAVHIMLGKVGSRSLQTLYKITDPDDTDILYATGDATQVWVDAKTEKAVQLPEPVKQYLQHAAE